MSESLGYQIYICQPAQRSFRKLEKSERTIARELIRPLKKDPRPVGCESVEGYDRILRVKRQDIRVIYSVADLQRFVIIIDVRRRDKDTYKNIPIGSLELALKQAITVLKKNV